MEKVTISEKIITPKEVKKKLKSERNKFPPIVDKKTKETFPPTKDVLDTSKNERTKLSNEKLQSMSNREFLAISPERRLENITKNNIKSEKVSEGKVNNIEFTFTFDGKYNKELYLKTTAGQVLPQEVGEVKMGTEIFKRSGLNGEFFNTGNKRLIIREGTKIDIEKIRTPDDINKIIESNNLKVNKFKESVDYKEGFDDIISESVKRGVDPKFAISAFGEKVEGKSIIDSSRLIEIEEMFTQFDRVRGGVTFLSGNKSLYEGVPDELAVRILKEFAGKDWKEKAEEYGIKKEEITRIENLNTAKYLNLTTRVEIISKAPQYVKDLVKKYFPASEYENALLVCHGESGFKANAINNKNSNGTVDRGLFQINNIHYKKYAGKNIFDPEVNVKVAVQIFNEAKQTWKPWYAARKIGLA